MPIKRKAPAPGKRVVLGYATRSQTSSKSSTCDHHGEPISPNHLSIMWRRAIAPLPVPKVTLHALRHSHASALIAAGVDVVTVSRRLGHGSPNITLSVYAHLMPETDKAAAAAIESILR